MARVAVLLLIAVSTLIPMSALAADSGADPAPATARPTLMSPATATAPAVVPLPGAVDEKSLGFGSSADGVMRVMGKPTSVAAVTGGEDWLYGRSRVTLIGGKVAGWSRWDRPLAVNIGRAKPGAPPAKIGSTAAEVVAALGTPDSVAPFGENQVWFYGIRSYTLRNGVVVPAQVRALTADEKAKSAASKAQAKKPANQPNRSTGSRRTYRPGGAPKGVVPQTKSKQ
jgi:outer membrane protein assembly factor BamE (lipoprotein component of BamABCDE complex)